MKFNNVFIIIIDNTDMSKVTVDSYLAFTTAIIMEFSLGPLARIILEIKNFL